MAFIKQVTKYKRKGMPVKITKSQEPKAIPAKENVAQKNNSKKLNEEMDEKINRAEEIMNNMKAANHVKVVKKDKGLIERTESSKIVLTEDNRQVLND
jgi:spore germination cell wall hydrolase CwlJ-like protein